MELAQLQVEVQEWASRNFPNATPWQPLIGMGEELGELAGAMLDRTMDGERATTLMKDAVGDIMIYMADYCWRNGIQLEAYVSPARSVESEPFYILAAIARDIGKLDHSHLKLVQGIRGTADFHTANKQGHIRDIVSDLETFCEKALVCSLASCIDATWGHVKQRDWLKNNKDGGVTPPA